MWFLLEIHLGPGINHQAGERAGVEAGREENPEEGRKGPSWLLDPQTYSKSGSSSFAVLKASFTETCNAFTEPGYFTH